MLNGVCKECRCFREINTVFLEILVGLSWDPTRIPRLKCTRRLVCSLELGHVVSSG